MFPSVKLAGPTEAASVPAYLRVNGQIPSWYIATGTFSRLVKQFEDHGVVPQALDYDSFTEAWANALWSRLYEVDNKATEWAKQTITLSFTGSYLFDSSSETFMPPVTFFSRIQVAAAARQKALSRCLSDVSQWQSIRVIGPGPYGYPVLHLGLYLSSVVERDALEPVIDAHVNNCMIAEKEGHEPLDVITTRKEPTFRSELVHGLGRRIPGLKSNAGITAESWYRRGAATAIRGGGLRPYRLGRSI